MRLSASDREIVRAKFGGRCAYCGCELGARWHADHFEAVRRGAWCGQPTERPENHRLDNMMPACAPCNLSKHAQSLESWRIWLAGHVVSLNRDHSIYRLCKAFGLVQETGAPIRFYFEECAALSKDRRSGSHIPTNQGGETP